MMDVDENAVDQPKIRVVIRKRPLNKKEIGRNETDIVDVINSNQVFVRQHKVKVDLTKYMDEHQFKFDHAISDEINNQQMYNQCVRPIVQCAFLGAKVTCFAYGQTGSGKTYTMNGDIENGCPGMYYLGAEDIFSLRDTHYSHLDVTVSFYEIYCGKLFDLLNNRQQLQARQDAKQNVNIIGLTVKGVNSIKDFMLTIADGSRFRITSQNSTNADSSRSHAILQIQLKQNKKTYGKISFIDLAGCERGADTLDQNKQTKIDGAQINKSLLALKECIRALDLGKNHTPFRGSKLTMVLKDSFTGFCKTLMIGNISPGSGSCENTLNTLRYADRVKELKKGGNEVSKEDRLAKELMLPRNAKNKQTIITNQSDSDEERIVASTHLKDKNNQLNLQMRQNNQKLNNKPKYILGKDQNCNKNSQNHNNTRKNIITSSQLNLHNQEVLKSVHHHDLKKGRNGHPQITRNKSMMGKQMFAEEIKNQLKNNQSWVMPRPIQQMPMNSERNSFQNHSFVNRRQLKDININLQNQLKHKNPLFSPLKDQPQSSVDHIIHSSDYKQWEKIINIFKKWIPTPNNFAQMSELFEDLVKLILKEELQIAELHKHLLLKDDQHHKQLLSMYHQAQTDNKNNQQMYDYAHRLSKSLNNRIKIFQQLKTKTEIYQQHLKEHEFCQNKLMQAGEIIGSFQIGLWQAQPSSLRNQ